MPTSVEIPPTGVYVPVPTFFSSDLKSTSNELQAKVDIDAQIQHSVFLAKNGIRGLILLGSTGEAIHLSRTERYELIAGVRKGLDDAGFSNYPIQAGVLTNGVDDTLEWLEDYKKAGAQWGLVLVPGYFGVAANQDNLIKWFTLIADKSPLPILIYNYPGVTNNILVSPETYTILAQHPNIVGCKMSHGNVSHHVQVSLDPEINHTTFRVYSGFGQQLGPIVYFGAAGVIDGLASFYPKTVTRLFALVEKNGTNPDTIEEIRKLQYVVSRAEEFIGKFGVVGIKEATYRVAGFGNLEGGRLPLQGRLADGDWEKWSKHFFEKIEEVEKSL